MAAQGFRVTMVLRDIAPQSLVFLFLFPLLLLLLLPPSSMVPVLNTLPLRTKNWDKALVEFVAAMLMDRTSPPLSKRLHEISCPVLIITGDSDRLVPSWNAVKLSQAIPGSHLEVIKHCGHLPQEEKADEFVSIVQKFLHRAFADPQEQ